MTTIVEEIIEISENMLIPSLDEPPDSEFVNETILGTLDEMSYDTLVKSNDSNEENSSELGENLHIIKTEDSEDSELGGTLMAVMLPDGSTAFIKDFSEELQNNTENTCLIEADDVLISETSPSYELKNNLEQEVEENQINFITEEPDPVQSPSEENVQYVNGQTIQMPDGSMAFIPMQEEENNEELYYPMLQIEDGSTAYITFPSDIVSSIETVDNKEKDKNKDVQNQAELNSEKIKAVADLTKETVTEREKRIRPRQFPCEYENCGKFYTTMHHLKVHERTHTGARPYTCPVKECEKAFATGYGLKAHIRTHTGEKPYKCPVQLCTKSFKTSGDLQKHVRTHTGERPFLCPIPGCGRRFTTSNIRKVHVRTHTGEKPYVCPEATCKRAFASATNYKNHLRIHSGEKPYVCHIKECGKRFTEYSSLYKHALVHTQFRPYACNLCQRRYRQVSNLTLHKRTFHGIVEADDGTQLVLSEAVLALARNSKKIRGLNCQNFLFNKESNTLIALTSDNVPMTIEENDDETETQLEIIGDENIAENENNSNPYLFLPHDLVRLEYEFQEDSTTGDNDFDSETTITSIPIESE